MGDCGGDCVEIGGVYMSAFPRSRLGAMPQYPDSGRPASAWSVLGPA